MLKVLEVPELEEIELCQPIRFYLQPRVGLLIEAVHI
jgi:hypothetical protein